MNKGGTIEPFPGVKIPQVHAEHSSEMILKDPVTGKDTSYFAGEPVGFIQFENGFKIYHTGDTGLFGDMKFIGEYYKPDLVLVPIGGHYVMDPKDAAYATKELIKPKMAWPMHYASTPFLKGTPAEFKAALGQSPVQVIDAEPGASGVVAWGVAGSNVPAHFRTMHRRLSRESRSLDQCGSSTKSTSTRS